MAIELFTLSETPSMANFNKRIEQANAQLPPGVIAMWGQLPTYLTAGRSATGRTGRRI